MMPEKIVSLENYCFSGRLKLQILNFGEGDLRGRYSHYIKRYIYSETPENGEISNMNEYININMPYINII